MNLVEISNAGKKIKETNFFDSEEAQNGIVMLSINAGCIRLLLPDNMLDTLSEMKTGKKVIISCGPWPQEQRDPGFEILFDDYSGNPFALWCGEDSWDIIPEKTSMRTKWDFAIWTRSGCMHQKKCYYRIVPEIPYMKKWGK